ncbi:MAG TPA: PilT/PilU family type 4a pilus ATPase [Verrucomicrobiae bacterium]|jgi:twitching motility protein PilT|nr:PilT/PilU family type 4a pilus ATPase [Verrucomicrobiae bacterium]
MRLDSLIESAAGSGASDLHLEAGMPAALRVRGALQMTGEPIAPKTLVEIARELLGAEQWPVFLERGSFDLSRTIHGVRCRINILQTARGVGLAIRLLSAFQSTVEKLNLHPDLKKLVKNTHGLILVSGPTGSGKSSTLAALIQEINLTETLHVITVESPIEYAFRSRRAFIRQREVGRDTPSFEQALLDALREDPDVLMVGEMRDPETMRLTLSASETGHLVLATVHSSNCAEALQRVASAFPAEIQNTVCAQLADCLVAVVAQRLHFREDLNIRVPECEILMATNAVRNFIRTREFFKIISALETGAEHGMWTFQRYAKWLDGRSNFFMPGQNAEPPDSESPDDAAVGTAMPPLIAAAKMEKKTASPLAPRTSNSEEARRIEIEPVEGDFGKILKQPE